MQSLKWNFTQLPLAMVCKSPQNSGILSALSRCNILNSKRCMDTLYESDCEDCGHSYRIPGPKKNLKRMKKKDPFKSKDPCWQSLRRTEYKCRTDPEFLLDSFIEAKKKCLEDPCAFDVPRADLTHYRPSDKLCRKYPRTWIKCVLKKRKRKMKCAWKPVVFKRRVLPRGVKVKGVCDENLCTVGAKPLGLRKCKPDPCCPRITMPLCCKSGVVPPSCKRGGRKPKNCRKRQTKYPAFSECIIDPLPTAPPVECKCLRIPSMCSVWEYYRNRKS